MALIRDRASEESLDGENNLLKRSQKKCDHFFNFDSSLRLIISNESFSPILQVILNKNSREWAYLIKLFSSLQLTKERNKRKGFLA
jgi:hypothetical protein